MCAGCLYHRAGCLYHAGWTSPIWIGGESERADPSVRVEADSVGDQGRHPLRKRLTDAFLKIPAMADDAKRDLYVEELAEQFPDILDIRRHDTLRHTVFELVRGCLKMPGALRTFWQIVKEFHPGDGLSAEIDALVAAADPHRLLRDGERTSLLAALESVDASELHAAYLYTARFRPGRPDVDTSVLATVVPQVESMNQVAGCLHPIFTFADHIAHQGSAEHDRLLHQWIDETAARLGFEEAAVRELCRTTLSRLPAARRHYLVVKLEPDNLAPNQYFLTVWRQHGDEPEVPIHGDDESVPLPAVAAMFDRLVDTLAEQVGEGIADLIVEIILPRALMTEAVDQWVVGPVLTELGARYPLVLRSLERLQRVRLHGRWATKWQWLKEHDHSSRTEAIAVISSHSLDDVRVLLAQLLAGEPPAVVVMLTPLPESAELAADGFAAALDGGAPIVLWCREARHIEMFHSEILRFVAAEGSLKLPQNIRQLRLETMKQPSGSDHVGRHIAVAFDDYDRIPEQFRSRARFRAVQPREAKAT
jgi:hypothetical protein